MKGSKNSASFTLGELVAMVEEIEEAQGGTAWGEEIIILFHANFANTMTLLCSTIKSLALTDQSPYNPSDFEAGLQTLNAYNPEDFPLDEEEFCRGFYDKKGMAYPVKQEKPPVTVPKPEGNPKLSFNLGEFFAMVQCMEFASGSYQGEEEDLEGEGVLMMLDLNFSSTVSLLKKGIQSLPEETLFHGAKLTLTQVKEAWQQLSTHEITPDILNHAAFLDGYDRQVSQYRGQAKNPNTQ